MLLFAIAIAASMGFFFLMSRRPPRSTRTDTLVPYTTLFRSHAGAIAIGRLDDAILDLFQQVQRLQPFDHQPARLERFEAEQVIRNAAALRSEEHTSELQSLMRISYAVFCLKKKTKNNNYIMSNAARIQKRPYNILNLII